MRKPLCLSIMSLLWCAAAFAQASRTLILVRHAERPGGMSTDEGISEIGRCRAEVLAKMLADSGIARIFVSEVSRTAQTAEPTATRLGIRPEVTPAKDVDALIKKLRAIPAAGHALVVGHSNTVPDIIKKLGGGTVAPISDTEFDRLFVVTLISSGRAAVTTLRYPGCER